MHLVPKSSTFEIIFQSRRAYRYRIPPALPNIFHKERTVDERVGALITVFKSYRPLVAAATRDIGRAWSTNRVQSGCFVATRLKKMFQQRFLDVNSGVIVSQGCTK
jgi:hypothetical protein